MAIISTGQITIVDLYDAPVLNAWISASQTIAQTYNNTAVSWSPNYATTPFQVLTLNLTRAGSGTSLIGAQVPNIKWKRRIGTTETEITSTTSTDTEYKSGTSHSILTTKTNTATANNAVVWTAEGVWNDPDTGLAIAFNASITLTLVHLAKASIVLHTYAPNGDFFRNLNPATLKINADLYKEGALSSGSRYYKWFAADSSVTTSQDADGGVGWAKLMLANTTMTPNTEFNIATTLQGVLTVKPAAVVNGQTFKVVVIDNAGGTSGQKATGYLTLRDMDDPIMVIIDSTAGDVFKNGAGATTLSARLIRQGDEVDSGGTLYTYKWYKWQNGVMVANFGGTGIAFKTGKTLAVGSGDVDTVTTFKVEVS